MSTSLLKKTAQKWVKFDDEMNDFEDFSKSRHETNQEFNHFTKNRLNETQKINELTQRRLDKYVELSALDKSPETSKKWSFSIDHSSITGWSAEILKKCN